VVGCGVNQTGFDCHLILLTIAKVEITATKHQKIKKKCVVNMGDFNGPLFLH